MDNQNYKAAVNSGTILTRPNDKSDEVLINPETTFDELLRILMSNPEIVAAENLEREVQECEKKEARLRAEFGKDYNAILETPPKGQSLKKAKRRPGAAMLRAEISRIAVKQLGDVRLCEVFVNGYAVYDNGDRKTVLWVPDCGSTTYHFTKLRDNEKLYQVEKDTVEQNVMGSSPWYIALMIAGENSIERNLVHPEEAYIKKEEAEERRERVRNELNSLKENQRKVTEMYYLEGKNQYEIADEIGITQSSVSSRLKTARIILEKSLSDLS